MEEYDPKLLQEDNFAWFNNVSDIDFNYNKYDTYVFFKNGNIYKLDKKGNAKFIKKDINMKKMVKKLKYIDDDIIYKNTIWSPLGKACIYNNKWDC